MLKKRAKALSEDLGFMNGLIWDQKILNQMQTNKLTILRKLGAAVHTPGESALEGEIQVRPALQFNKIQTAKASSLAEYIWDKPIQGESHKNRDKE